MRECPCRKKRGNKGGGTAKFYWHSDLVQAILELEGGVAGVTMMDAEGRGAAHLACAAEKGGVEVVKELVTKGN